MMANPNKVNPRAAMEALHRANGDRQKAYSEYIRLHFQSTGQLTPKCDAKDLYAYYDKTLLELWKAAKDVVDAAIQTDEVSVSAPDMALQSWIRVPEDTFNRLRNIGAL